MTTEALELPLMVPVPKALALVNSTVPLDKDVSPRVKGPEKPVLLPERRSVPMPFLKMLPEPEMVPLRLTVLAALTTLMPTREPAAILMLCPVSGSLTPSTISCEVGPYIVPPVAFTEIVPPTPRLEVAAILILPLANVVLPV